MQTPCKEQLDHTSDASHQYRVHRDQPISLFEGRCVVPTINEQLIRPSGIVSEIATLHMRYHTNHDMANTELAVSRVNRIPTKTFRRR